MNQKTFRIQWIVVAVTTLLAVTHLGWEYIHGGVKSHHFMADPDMPAISNWWSLVILPVLGWLTSWTVLRRTSEDPDILFNTIAGAIGAFIAGTLLSVSFATGSEKTATYIFFGAILSGLYFPVYRTEYILGFVLGMTFVFGAVLPGIFGVIAAAISATFHFLVRPAIAWTLRQIRD